jgi:16S rRNA (uracil1498-N3)-methyltransferase
MSDPLRFFVATASLRNDRVLLEGETHHHLRNVLRIRPGSTIVLLDGLGQCCEALLEQLQADHGTARVTRRWQAEERALPIILLQALPKGDKFDLVLQKGTELGISCFQPVETTHAIPQLNQARQSKRQHRWRRIVNEAARQSRRCFLPEVKPLQKLTSALENCSSELKLVLWESGAVPLSRALPQAPPAEVSLLVGPEGGFSTAEIEAITANGFQAVHLGPRILRTETAGLAATPVLQYLYGDWQLSPDHDNSQQHEEKR